jgi:acetyltransferase-like isoleucine patch superfamily enzyme
MSLKMGVHTYGDILITSYDGEVIVGKFCSLASGVQAVFLLDHHTDWITTYPFCIKWVLPDVGRQEKHQEGITVGNDVWIGANVILLGGANIQDGAVIGAYSVVSGQIPPYTVAVGNPARPVKKRFSDKEIKELLEIKWWDWPEDKIKKFAKPLSSGDIKNFIREIKEYEDV